MRPTGRPVHTSLPADITRTSESGGTVTSQLPGSHRSKPVNCTKGQYSTCRQGFREPRRGLSRVPKGNIRVYRRSRVLGLPLNASRGNDDGGCPNLPVAPPGTGLVLGLRFGGPRSSPQHTGKEPKPTGHHADPRGEAARCKDNSDHHSNIQKAGPSLPRRSASIRTRP